MNKELKQQIINEILKEINKEKTVYIEKMSDDIVIPVYASEGDAGMDIRASEDIVIKPHETKLVSTGIKIAIPAGYEIQIRPRSGMSLKTNLRIANSPGTIDSGYRDELKIIVTNISINEDLIINKGDRVAQIVLCKYEKISFKEVKDIKTIEGDRGGGFGHSGIN